MQKRLNFQENIELIYFKMTIVSPQVQLFCEFYDINAFGLLKKVSYIRKYKIASIVS